MRASSVILCCLILMAVAGCHGLSESSGSGDHSSCEKPGQACTDPSGGLCTLSGSKISCECASDQTIVSHNSGEKMCQTKLLDIHCKKDTDAACLMVKDSVCAPHEGRCTCQPSFVYTAHRHQCKPIYNREESPQRQYCKVCKFEGGMCIKEDEIKESNGPLVTEGGQTFRLSCACPGGFGVPKYSSEDKWAPKVCSTRLRDIDEVCDDSSLLCRSKRAVCRKSRDVETDFKRCQCPENSVPVYQPWLKYYECFEKLNIRSEACKECGAADPFGICFAPSNESQPDCLCPKRMSSPAALTGKGRKYCSKNHVSVKCQYNRMSVTFDSSYDSPPYSELPSRLRNGLSLAFVESYPESADDGACKLTEVPVGGGLYTAELETNSDTKCGRTIQNYRMGQEDIQVLKATLKVLWNRNFYSYPDMVVNLMCQVATDDRRSVDPKIIMEPRKLDPGRGNIQPPAGVSKVRVSLQVLNRAGRAVLEAQEGDPIRLDVRLDVRLDYLGRSDDPSRLDDQGGTYSTLLVQQCSVANESTVVRASVTRGGSGVDSGADGGSSGVSNVGGRLTRLIGCGGEAVSDSGFTASFQPTRAGDSTHQQSSLFPAFRLGNLPSLYFICTVQVCKDSESSFCLKDEVCVKEVKMFKRSPDDGVRQVDSAAHIVVIAAPTRRAENYTRCQHSMCLSAVQVIVIILILLVLLALVSGLIVVVYRRRLLIAAHRLRLEANDELDTPTQTPVDALCKGSLMQHHHQQLLRQQQQQQQQHQYLQQRMQPYHLQPLQPQHQQQLQQHPSGHCSLPRMSPARRARDDDVGAAANTSVDGALRAYATLPATDRGLATLKEPPAAGSSRYCSSELQQQQQQHQRLCQAAAQLLDNRPDVCTCDRSAHSSYSITSSQV